MTTIKKSDLVLSLGQRLLLLLCIFLICYLLTMGSAYIIGRALGSNPAAAIRITTVIQDLMTFIVPAVATAVFVTRRPADLLCLTRSPRIVFFIGILAILVVSIPVQEAIIYWNHNITLPQSMSAFENAARTMENSAFQAMATLLSDTSVPALAVNILIIGILAGLSEELLFRGCFQRLLTTGGVNRHVAIWTVAICFSALHFQLFGFVPRILLGAYFGYLLLWSGSLWAPVTAHVLNNILFVATAFRNVRTEGITSLSNEPSLWSWESTAVSFVITTAVIWWLYRSRIGNTAGGK